MKNWYPMYLAGEAVDRGHRLPVYDKYRQNVVAEVAEADHETVIEAIEAAATAVPAMRAMGAWERRDVLARCANRFAERSEELARALCAEAGKPIRDARGEVQRLIDTFRIGSEEATRAGGEVMTLDVTPRAKGYGGMWKRVPIGVCAFITPFNFPLNLVAHKVAPAIAAGCPFVLKPSEKTPIGALIIGEVLAETKLPAGAFSILPCSPAAAEPLITDERVKLLSFTGSAAVGWSLKSRAGKKKVALELGGNAAVIVDEDADLEDAVERIVFGAFYQSGQSCISVQRILAHAAIYEELRTRLVAATEALVAGDPAEEDTFVGPLISEKDAQRIESWIAAAVGRGARLLCGGTRHGSMLTPALVEDVPPDEKLWREEVFGPVAALARFERFDDAVAAVNDSRYGLQAGVFTRDVYKVLRAWDELEVGGVIAGDVPSWRVDHMPYGGVKDSGLGREGLRWGIEEMTEVRLLVIRTPPRG